MVNNCTLCHVKMIKLLLLQENTVSKIYFLCFTALLTFSISISQAQEDPVDKNCIGLGAKQIVAGVEVVQLYEIAYHARVDTGANTSSLNAYDFYIEKEQPQPSANIGKWLHFTTKNEDGESKQLVAKIVKTETVRNAQGAESRYVVLLPIRWQGHEKTIEVNLRNREAMQFALLLGRNWLKNDFVVDVDKER